MKQFTLNREARDENLPREKFKKKRKIVENIITNQMKDTKNTLTL